MIPAGIAEQAERRLQRQRLKEARRPKRNHHGKKPLNRDRPFIGWDGEGPKDAGYALLGNSLGNEICHPYLGTKECLELVLDTEDSCPDAIHVGFGFNYDVSNILRNLSWKHMGALKHWNRTEWEGYELEHIPGKWFQIKRAGTVAKIYDIRSFFGTNYVGALRDMGIGSREEIAHLTTEKARRSEFLWSEIEDIREYYHLELRLMPKLCERLRESFLDAGFDVRSWHGPGALANMAMRRHGVFNAKAVTPASVQSAARFAFAGGRFEQVRGGYIQRKVYVADLHSAYPSFARQLPNLARGIWRAGRDYEPGRFAVYRIRYKSAPGPLRAYPLFRRMAGGEVVWTHDTEGWFWGPEAELVRDDPDATFLEALVFDEEDESDRPFEWIEEYYRKRQYLKEIGSVLELTFKLIINAIYGQLAQRTGWDRKTRTPPRSHQLEWAGYITSACRAAVWRVGVACGDDLLSIDTDGVSSLRPFDNLDVGDNLGQWELDEYDAGIFWQSGIYALKAADCRDKKCYNHKGKAVECGHEWTKGKTRGIPKGTYKPEQLIGALEMNEPLKLTRKSFIGYGLALNGQRERLNTWVSEPSEIIFGGEGKRYHNDTLWCGKRGCKNGIHDFISRPVRWSPSDTRESVAHSLPWIGPDPLAETRKGLVSDSILYDANHLDYDEGWVTEYVLDADN